MDPRTGLPEDVTSARNIASNAAKTANDFSIAALTIPDQLHNVINDTLKANKDLYDARSSSLANFFAAPTKGEAKFGVETFGTGPQAGQANPEFIFNPFERNAAISQFTANELTPFLTQNALLGNVVGSGEKLINAETNQMKARAGAAQSNAEIARQFYSDVLNEFKLKEDLRMKQEQLDLDKKKQDKNGTGSIPEALAWIQQLKNGTIKNFTQIPAEMRGTVVQLLDNAGINVNDIAKAREGEQVAATLKGLYNQYYGEEGQQDDLSFGRLGGAFANLKAGLGQEPRVTAYNKTREGLLANLKQITGDTGILTDPDAVRLVGLLADPTSTPGEATLLWSQMDSLLKSKYGIGILEDPAFKPK